MNEKLRCWATALTCTALLLTRQATADEGPGKPVRLTPAQSRYLEGCGGCHGIDGSSASQLIPELRGVVGVFLCTRESREYIVRLPNVAFADVNDQMLAEVMNFVVFGLGGASAPAGAIPYSAAEVARLRHQPLKNQHLVQLRTAILGRAIEQCARRPR